MTKKRYGPELVHPVDRYGAKLNSTIVAFMLEHNGLVPRGIWIPWRTWIHIWNQPRLRKEWGFRRLRRRASRSRLMFSWQGRKIVLRAKNREGWHP